MTELSAEQLAIIDAPLEPMSVVACAGSGKTRTAVRRLAEIRKRLGDHRGRIALLSFSNVAVDTFRQSYQSLAKDLPPGIRRDRVEIDTLDGFITGNVLRSHAHRTMGATQAAFLVMGGESFLNGFTFKTSTYPLSIAKMQVGVRAGAVYFYHAINEQTVEMDTAYAAGIVHRLGRTGAYTHNLGRYWCFRVLLEQPAVLRALARRYPHILIDESQDIGTLHQAILEQLIKAGTQVSLIGDPYQGIYEFAGANGKFLTQYGQRAGVNGYDHVARHDFIGARQVLEQHVLPFAEHYRMLDRIVAIRSQYAVVLAYCRDFPAAEQEIERLEAYAGGFTAEQRREIDGQRALIADLRAGNGPQQRRIFGPQPSLPVVEQRRRLQAKVGRNDPCPCGSGLKYKKCHGLEQP